MAVIWYTEVWPDREGHTDVTSEKNYRRIFIVQTDDLYDGPAVVLQYFHDTDGLPFIGDAYDTTPLDPAGSSEDVEDTEGDFVTDEEFDSDCVCTNLDPKQMQEDGFFWQVTCYYTNRPQSNPDEYGLDPTERQTEVQWGIQTYTKALQKDFSSPARPILNTAGLPFSNPPETAGRILVLTLRRWEKTGSGGFNPIDMNNTYSEKVNSVDWKATPDDSPITITIPKRCALMKGITADRCWEQGAYFQRVTYTIWIKFDTWDFLPLDAGFHFRVRPPLSNAGQLMPFISQGAPSGTPGLLDGQGHLLNDTGTPANSSGVAANPAVYFDGTTPAGSSSPLLPYQVYESVDFNAISPNLYIPV